MIARSSIICLLLSVGAAGCGGGDRRDSSAPQTTEGRPPAESQPPARTGRPRIAALGDSLTAGLGLSPQLAYPAILQERLDRNGMDYEVVNAGVSGDTSAGGLSRLEWALEGDVRVLIVALGGNDGLRGLPAAELRGNLAAIIRRAKDKGVAVILAGMEAPPNLGSQYARDFREVYPSLAREFGVPLVPFLLEGVAGQAAMNQSDGIHPTAEGARIVADNIWAVLEDVLERQKRTSSRQAFPGRIAA